MFLLLHYVLCHRANVPYLTPSCRDNSLARILPWIEPLLRESVDKDYAGHCPAQTPRVGFSGFDPREVVLLQAGFGESGLVLAWRG
jgi:hypothetical protein